MMLKKNESSSDLSTLWPNVLLHVQAGAISRTNYRLKNTQGINKKMKNKKDQTLWDHSGNEIIGKGDKERSLYATCSDCHLISIN